MRTTARLSVLVATMTTTITLSLASVFKDSCSKVVVLTEGRVKILIFEVYAKILIRTEL